MARPSLGREEGPEVIRTFGRPRRFISRDVRLKRLEIRKISQLELVWEKIEDTCT